MSSLTEMEILFIRSYKTVIVFHAKVRISSFYGNIQFRVTVSTSSSVYLRKIAQQRSANLYKVCFANAYICIRNTKYLFHSGRCCHRLVRD